jgi:hypothetical protein
MKDVLDRPDRATQTNTAISRRCFLVSTIAFAGTGALPAWAELPITEIAYNRMIKAAAHYQSRPNGKQRCAGCKHFRAPNSCEIVIGNISPRGWCRYYHSGPAVQSEGSGSSY